ncbi:hypothetical protein LWI29_016343 [Acer saccharum]|uniref:S-protein homolog n=1 Tax=Acer saccharum TaxID=4024 RepID=A0AA39TG76_ACESA|nr:hypothetical protein LWI29_016343 [Acer saccharum]
MPWDCIKDDTIKALISFHHMGQIYKYKSRQRRINESFDVNSVSLIYHQAKLNSIKYFMLQLARMSNAVVVLLLVLISLWNQPVLSQNQDQDQDQHEHVSITNRLGNGKNLSLHCQSKDNDLGQHNLADGTEFAWDFSVNAWGTTLFYCDLEWEGVQQYHFDAYAFDRDYVRCQTQCLWLISTEGIYGLNGQTGFWEYIYHWTN